VTEKEWRTSTHLASLTDFAGDRKLSRKLRLFGCALCRRFGKFLAEGPILQAVETAERFADKQASRRQLASARAAVKVQRPRSPAGWVSNAASFVAAAAARNAAFWAYSTTHEAAHLLYGRSPHETDPYVTWAADLLRHVVGDPFQRQAVERTLLRWNDGAIPALARAAYEARSLPDGHLDATRLSVLADALEEAACGGQALAEHLRGPGPHVRGCWVVDLLAGNR
jgi:hypothetical protein